MRNDHDAMGIAAEAVDFFGIGKRDWANLRRIARAVERAGPAALDRFYAKVRQTPAVGKLFHSEQLVAHARGKQLEHWRYLFSHEVDATFVENSEKIGEVHARIGLEPRWYIGGYARVLEDMVGEIVGKRGALLGGGNAAAVV
ncbi:MAG TPA: protoglobin domain-containing protein, partial [Novosphingobium sp.]